MLERVSCQYKFAVSLKIGDILLRHIRWMWYCSPVSPKGGNTMPAEAAKQSVENKAAENIEVTEGERERSTISFPYHDLDDVVKVAKAVHAVGGSSCQWDQVAAHLGQSSTSGTFRLRMLAAKIFAVLTYDKSIVSLTPLGIRICDTQQEQAARAEAFLAVPLYLRVYEQFKGASLPPSAGLESAIVAMGVAPKQKDRARQVLQRSAKQAGFFNYGIDRLVMPSVRASAAATPAPEPESGDEKKKKEKEEHEERRHPLIEGLLKELPEPQTEWTTEERKKWLEMASTIFNVIYKDSDDSRGSLKVVVERVSAKQ
jgi:hypothetical protein